MSFRNPYTTISAEVMARWITLEPLSLQLEAQDEKRFLLEPAPCKVVPRGQHLLGLVLEEGLMEMTLV